MFSRWVSAGWWNMTTMPAYPLDEGTTVYTEDGTHSGKVSCSGESCSFFLNGIKKATYFTLDYPIVSGNDFYVLATDQQNKKHLLKNGWVIASWEVINTILGYYGASTTSQFEWWYIQNNGKYSVFSKDGNKYLEVDNAGTASNSYYIADKVLLTTIYNQNNLTSSTYINTKKIPTSWDGYVQSYGIYKKSIKDSEVLLSSSNYLGTMELMMFNIKSWELRPLPGYDGITQIMTIYNKNGTIKDFQYVANVENGYAFADMNGKILSKEFYDTVNTFTSYGDSYLKIFTKNEKMFMHFEGRLYGPYDFIDTFNPSYGNQLSTTKVLRWSVFVKNNGKNYILVNGKQIAID
jgi:hypothetical protein